MPEQALVNGDVRPARDTFVISKTPDGYRVYAVHQPSRSFMVKNDDGRWTCDCYDYASRKSDPAWRCRHILAVAPMPANFAAAPEAEANGKGRPVPATHGERDEPVPPAQMLIKRSVSPDGRIDSVSVEFTLSVQGDSQSAITDKAVRTLRLQKEIVAQFLAMNGKAAEPSPQPKPNGAPHGEGNGQPEAGEPVPARITDISEIQGRWGPRLVLNVQVNGNRCALFGSPKQLASHLANAGCSYDPQDLRSGLQLNQPCRVITEPSKDGKYVNVVEILAPVNQHNGHRNGRAQ